MNPKVLYLSHGTESCGVMQFGRRLITPALESKRYDISIRYVESYEQFAQAMHEVKPQIIVWNYYSEATMPWMFPGVVRAENAAGRKTMCIFHEVPIDHMEFQYYVHQDPTAVETDKIKPVSRPIPFYKGYTELPKVPTIGSFGFGLGGKGFTRLVDKVNADFTEAVIRLRIPYAAFGDKNGQGARQWAAECAARITKPGIKLDVQHDFVPEAELLRFLASNTLNAFLYDENYGRGISGTTDYALAAGRPIAISRSYQFQHLWQVDDRIVVGERTLQDMIDQGTEFHKVYFDKWGGDKLLRDWERLFDGALH